MSTRRVKPARAAGPEFTSLAAAIAAMLAAPVVAADRDDSVDEVTVEGEQMRLRTASGKFTAPLIDTPKSVTVISQALIAETGSTTLVDALRTCPASHSTRARAVSPRATT